MLHTLQTSHLQLVVNTDTATWSLSSTQPDGAYLDGVSQFIQYRRRRKKFRALEKWTRVKVSETLVPDTPHGTLQQLVLTIGPDQNKLLYTLTFALPEKSPLLMWKLEVDNQGAQAVHIRHIEMLSAGFFPEKRRLPQAGPVVLKLNIPPMGRGTIRPNPAPGELAFFANGWQSWSHSGAYGLHDTYRNTRLGFFAAQMWHNTGTPRPEKPGHFASDMFGVLGDRQHRTGILAGFLSQKEHFGSLLARIDDPLYPALRLWANGDDARLDPGASITTDWAAIQFVDVDAPDPLAAYLDAVGRENALTPHSPLPVGEGLGVRAGWCSWYHFFQNIDAKKIRANLHAAQETQNEIPLDLFQIDDGFEAKPGDWFENAPGFPKGVTPLAAEIRQTGFTPGLWLAPFIVHSRARLRRRHRNWLLRNRWGLPVNAGFVWNNLNKALDLTHPEALNYACDVVRTAVHEWGYPYLKLDFLYAAALNGRFRDRTQTRAQVLRKGLEALREAAGPQVELLGCGVPLGSSIGIFDAMRIGADVAPTWLPNFSGHEASFRNEASMPSARNALQNTLTRASMHGRWWINDPDCLLLRSDSALKLPEVQSLATAIALSGGALLLSDDLPNVPTDRLRIAQQLLPLIGQTPRVLDWLDEPMPRLLRLDLENETGPWYLLAIFNWDDQERDENIPLERFGLDGEYFVRSFWDGIVDEARGGLLPLKHIPPHGVKLLALTPGTVGERAVERGRALYLGSDLHISQGLEVKGFTADENSLKLELHRPGHAQGQVDLHLPTTPREGMLNNLPMKWQSLPGHVYRLDVDFHAQAKIEIHW